MKMTVKAINIKNCVLKNFNTKKSEPYDEEGLLL